MANFRINPTSNNHHGRGAARSPQAARGRDAARLILPPDARARRREAVPRLQPAPEVVPQHAKVLLRGPRLDSQAHGSERRAQALQPLQSRMVARHLPLQRGQLGSLPAADITAPSLRDEDDERRGRNGGDLSPGMRCWDGVVRLPEGDDMRHGQGVAGLACACEELRVLRLSSVHDDGE